jgi:tetratricopeptide (TPR) repeat protein
MRKSMLIVLSLFCFSNLSNAKILNNYFVKANDLYKKGDFKNALDIYKDINSQGYYSKELFYNMSNSYYRLNNLGSAIQYIEKAYRLSPRDSDIKFNRNFLYNQTGQTENLSDTIAAFISMNELLFICLCLFSLLFLVMIISKYYNQRWLFWIKFSIVSLLALFVIWLYLSYSKFYKNPIAIVLNTQANIYSGPGDDNSISFTIPEGKKIIILNKRENWYEIGVKDQGLRGWINRNDVGEV